MNNKKDNGNKDQQKKYIKNKMNSKYCNRIKEIKCEFLI